MIALVLGGGWRASKRSTRESSTGGHSVGWTAGYGSVGMVWNESQVPVWRVYVRASLRERRDRSGCRIIRCFPGLGYSIHHL